MKVKLFTHTDLDGIGCAVVGKYVFDDIDVTYCDYNNVNQIIGDYLSKGDYFNYDVTYITDISVDDDTAYEIDKLDMEEHKFILLDHHATAEGLNRFEWATVTPEHEDGTKSAGTSMLFVYLNLPHGLLDFVEEVRRYDTWEWSTKYNDIHAKTLNDLFHLIGRNRFVERFVKNPSVELMESEQLIVDIEQAKIKAYIGKKENSVKQIEWNGYKVGVVFAEQYLSQLGNELAKKFDYLDFIAMINPGGKSISYRGIHNHVDLGKDVAKVFGGGGHPKASGSPITEDALNGFISMIFNKY
jgi:oligoribonuclease NrnB/cAMP/cGMP phosphodiesterase (DHH superfamily)